MAKQGQASLIDRLNTYVESKKSRKIWLGLAICILVLSAVWKPIRSVTAARTIQVTVISKPKGAKILYRGIDSHFVTPATMTFTQDDDLGAVSVELDGYEQYWQETKNSPDSLNLVFDLHPAVSGSK